MRILALDIGDVRIGVASSDLLGIIASPLEVIDRKKVNPYQRINELIKEKQVKKLVAGLPRSLDGKENLQAAKVREFLDELKDFIGDMEIILVDERYSTVSAEKMLRSSTKKNAREKRKVVDKVAATIILQTYLNSKK